MISYLQMYTGVTSGVTNVTVLDLVHDVLVYFYTLKRLQLIYNRFNKCQNPLLRL